MDSPKISIICPLHNKISYIGETIKSVLEQTWEDWELLIVENGSTDGGAEFAATFVDERIKVLVSQKCGPGAARNHGISNAVGEWILFLDADDLINPDYLKNQLAFAGQHSEAEVIVGQWVQFLDGSTDEEVKSPPGYPYVNRSLVDSAIAFTPWAPNAAIVRRKILRGEYLWPEHMDKLLAEDTPFWFKLLSDFRVDYSASCDARYRFLSAGCRTDMKPARWFEGLNAAVEENLRFLRSQGKDPTAIQMEQLGLLYFGIYEMAVQAKDKSTSLTAAQKARFWMRGSLFAGRIAKLPMLIGGLFGVNALSFIKRKITTNAG